MRILNRYVLNLLQLKSLNPCEFLLYNLSRMVGRLRWIVAEKREEQEIEKKGCLNGKIVALTVIRLQTLLEISPYST